jgi:S-layer protein (TIGR01567 family)
MKRLSAIMLTAMMVLFASVVAVSAQEVQVRGQVTNLGIPEFTWDNSSFAGFYYDIDKNLGAETLTFRLSNANPASATLSDQADANNNRGIVYNTQGQDKTFKFKAWGSYKVIGFLAERYFAAYNNYAATPEMEAADAGLMYLADKSKNDNMMTNEQIAKVLMDDNKEMTITSETPLMLGEGYKLAIKNVDTKGNKAYVELTKDGTVVDSKVVQPSIDGATMADKTYYYKTDIGDTKEIVQIAVHFKNAFAGTDTNIATVDGEFQISDTATPLKSDQQYDKMSIRNVNPTEYTITMDNKDNQVTLSKNKDVVLMQNIYIKTADQDTIDASQPLRYYIYKKYTEPGQYQLRGSVTNLGQNEYTWTNATFSGFYYDIDKNIGDETITFRLSNANPASATLSDQADANNNRGIVYNTQGQDKTFKFKPWGSYKVIGFLAERYFAAYNNYAPTPEMEAAGAGLMYLADKSKNDNMMTNEQIAKVLMDDNKEMTMTTENPLILGEGYKLSIVNVDVDGNKAYVELTKDGTVVDSKVIQPSISGATMADQTYYYKTDIGDTKEIVQVAVHFKNAFAGADTNIATVDGEFQISDTATPLKSDQQYDKMSIRNVNPTDYTITMDNKDNQVTLSKNKDVVLMQDIYIKTADQDLIDDANPLRYFIYKAASIEAATQPAEPTPAAEAPAATGAVAETAAKAEAAKENVTAAVVTAAATEKAQEAAVAKVNETKEAAKEAVANATAAKEAAAGAAAEKQQPGFEGIFAITGLLAVAYLVLGRKQ